MPFIYDPKLKGSGYRDVETGRLISRAEVRVRVDRTIQENQKIVITLAAQVAEGSISEEQWLGAMKREIKDAYITLYLAGIGGIDQMSPADWGSVGGMLKEQYKWLESFYESIIAGDLTESVIANRSRMYINSSREAFNRAALRSAIQRGFKEKRWAMHSAVENCDDCIVLDGIGWIPILEDFVSPSTGVSTLPGRGDTICLTNCMCHLDFR
jgi:hypothetical protein